MNLSSSISTPLTELTIYSDLSSCPIMVTKNYVPRTLKLFRVINLKLLSISKTLKVLVNSAVQKRVSYSNLLKSFLPHFILIVFNPMKVKIISKTNYILGWVQSSNSFHRVGYTQLDRACKLWCWPSAPVTQDSPTIGRG